MVFDFARLYLIPKLLQTLFQSLTDNGIDHGKGRNSYKHTDESKKSTAPLLKKN